MRFVIAIILIVVFGLLSLANTEGISDIGYRISYILGGAILGPALIAALFCIPKSGRNNKRFFRVFNVVLIISIFAPIGELPTLVETLRKPPQTIVGSNGKIEIVVPTSWKSVEAPDENILLHISNGSGTLIIIVSYEDTGVDRLKLEHYAQLIGNNFKDKVPDFKSISTIEKCDSTKLECAYQIAYATDTTTILASLTGESVYYNFMAITNPGLLDNYRDDIFMALRSVNEIQKQMN